MDRNRLPAAGLLAALILGACNPSTPSSATPTRPAPGPTAPPATATVAAPVYVPSGGIDNGPAVTGRPGSVSPGQPPAGSRVSTPVAPPAPMPEPPRLNLPYSPVSGDAARVLDQLPAAGERLTPGSAITLTFDRAMNTASVEAAFKTQPATAGSFVWSDGGRKVVFKPAETTPASGVIDVGVAQSARAADGAPLREPFIARYRMRDPLQVAQVIPADGTTDVTPEVPVTILFNRPVVPLTVVSRGVGAPELPRPLTIEPAIEGTTEWVNTSILVFRPARPLPGGTQFRLTLDGALKDVDGNPIAGAFSWSFSTAAPRVLSVSPDPQATTPVPVDSVIRVRFNQDVDAESARAAFALQDARGGTVAGTASVLSATLTFTPTARLDFDAAYTVKVAAGIKSASGGLGSREQWVSGFKTYPRPRVKGTSPQNGQKDAYPYGGITIQFTAPVDPASVWARLRFSPAISLTRAFSGYNEYNNSFYVQAALSPSSDYTVELLPGVSDRWGNTIAELTRFTFSTAALPPAASLNIGGLPASFDAHLPVRVTASSNNVSVLNLALRAISSDELLSLSGRGFDMQTKPPGTPVRQWQVKPEGALNQVSRTIITLGEGDGRLKPGTYLLTMSAPELEKANRGAPFFAVFFVTEINLTAKFGSDEGLVWATDLKTGKPLADVALQTVTERYDPRGGTTTFDVTRSTTGKDGVARFPLNTDAQARGASWVLSAQPFGIVLANSSGGIAPYDFGLSYDRGNGGGQVMGHLYTDRAIYRPGQTVRMRGVLRNDDDGRYSPLAANQSVIVAAFGPRGQLMNTTLKLDDQGGFDAELVLPTDVALGQVSVSVQHNQDQVATAAFQISAYRAPEYEVTVTPARPAYARGETLEANLAAAYLAGGGLANTRMRWNIVATSATFSPPQLDQYSFADADSPWHPYPMRMAGPTVLRPLPAGNRLVIASGDSSTDGAGVLTLRVPISAEIRGADSTPMLGPLSFSIEGNATGADGQSIAGRSSVLIHPAALYVGVSSPGTIVRAGKPIEAGLVVVDWDGKRLAGQSVEAVLVQRAWKSHYDEEAGRWRSDVIDTPLMTKTVTSDANGEATATFTTDLSGALRIVARARDAQGRLAQSSRFVFVVGDLAASWLRDDSDRINLVANKAEYVAGDTAEILIPSPFAEDHFALVTIERGRMYSHEVIQVHGGTALYRLPITDAHAPNIYVSVVLIKPLTGAGERVADQADFKVGLVELTVKPVAQTLNINITADPALAQPGAQVSYEIRITDALGAPVAARFSLDVVDKGVLNLRPREANAIVNAFYGPRGDGVGTATTLSWSMNRRMAEEQQAAADAKGMGAAGAEPPRPAATGAPAAAPALGARAATAESNYSVQDAADDAPIRETFADTAFWKADGQTNADGVARVTVTLPDNLTTWVVRAVAIDEKTRVGERQTDTVATRPVLIRPVTPRFLVVGDLVELAAVVQNNTASTVSARVWLAESAGLALQTPAELTVEVPANGEATATWRARVQDVSQVDLLFRVAAGANGDASRPRLSTAPNRGIKVLRYSAGEIVGTAGALDAGGVRTEKIVLPKLLDDTQGTLSLRLDHSLIAATEAGFQVVEEYPYEGSEGVASRLMANVLSYQLLAQFPRPGDAQARLKEVIPAAIAKLATQQHADGGWGWYREGETNAHTTLWVGFALMRARQAGFAVNAPMLDRGLAYARQIVRATNTLRGPWAFNQQAYALYVLAEAGTPDKTRVNELYDARDNLGVYGRALLAQTVARLDGKDARLPVLLADLTRDAQLSATGAHWEERTPDLWGFNSDTRSTALALSALSRLDARNALGALAARWLMAARDGEGAWKSSYENTWVMMALIDYAAASGELRANFDYSVLLNGRKLGDGVATAQTLAQTRVFTTPVAALLRDTPNTLTLQRSAGDGKLYYTAHLRAALPASAVQALDRGIIVQRRYTLASCTAGIACPAVTQARVGDELRVSLTLIAPTELRYVQLEDTLPAGAEAVDIGLATTSQLATGVSTTRAGLERWYGNWWRWYVRAEMRDDRVAIFAPYLSRGTYEYSYTVRVTQAGEFNTIPAQASEQYFPEVFGRSDGALMVFTR
ncbi:MAG: Ig-like domain-containing protein [Thermoflexales bacterium]|nr:Ig-like domain-containing protein [Thermoflexales bacterium]